MPWLRLPILVLLGGNKANNYGQSLWQPFSFQAYNKLCAPYINADFIFSIFENLVIEPSKKLFVAEILARILQATLDKSG